MRILLPTIRSTLVLHRAGDRIIRSDSASTSLHRSRRVTSALATTASGSAGRGRADDEIDEFPRRRTTPTAAATVLFTDIVGSTAAELGHRLA
jgi:class 3 adenylate cyclase